MSLKKLCRGQPKLSHGIDLDQGIISTERVARWIRDWSMRAIRRKERGKRR